MGGYQVNESLVGPRVFQWNGNTDPTHSQYLEDRKYVSYNKSMINQFRFLQLSLSYSLKWGLVNYSPKANSGLPSFFVNKGLPQDIFYTHIHIICRCLPAILVELSTVSTYIHGFCMHGFNQPQMKNIWKEKKNNKKQQYNNKKQYK